MSSAHKRHLKTIEPYTLALVDIEKRIDPFNTKLKGYPLVRKHLFPDKEGELAFRGASSIVRSFEASIPKVVRAMENLSMRSAAYLRMTIQDHLPINDFIQLVAEDALKFKVIGAVSLGLLNEVLAGCSAAADETLLIARRSPGSSLVAGEFFAFFAIETAELRTSMRKINAALIDADKAYNLDSVHNALCPNCQAAKACNEAEMN